MLFRAEHAIMIEHGQSENGGPDMMISYHGEEHYNSVRDENAGMPPPPSRTSFEKRTAVIETNVSETEATSETDEMDIDEEPTTDAHYPLQNIREPTEHDVLFGRGAGKELVLVPNEGILVLVMLVSHALLSF